MNKDVKLINEKVARASKFIDSIKNEIHKVIIGQEELIDKMLIGLLGNGHILLEGVPGLAKTLTINTLAKIILTKFQRIQFTPDLLPADLIGTLIFNQKSGNFVIKKGPVFSNIILADEINRAPAKVQSALLESMQEHQVTIGENSYKLPEPFFVLATQNPIEQEGTYPLPEAQVDRFMLKLKVTYPEKSEEKTIVNQYTTGKNIQVRPVIKSAEIIKAQEIINSIYIDDKIINYILEIIFATREPENYGLSDLKQLIQWGASPRASLYLTLAAKANAFIRHRGYVIPDDVRYIGFDVLRHRIILTYEAEAEEVTTEDVIRKIFDTIEVP
ncbi:MAG: MoxR family ATPase [Spirochaetes bacterium]|nr:MoxR family ATPase [Spirochaetota bacterium]